MKVLIVEDNAAVRELFRILLSKYYEVITAESGIGAWSLIQSGAPPDVVMTDIVMPGLSGVGLLQAMQENCIKIPTVVVTGQPNRLDWMRYPDVVGPIDKGSWGVDGKSIRDTLMEAIDEAVGFRPRKERHFRAD